MLQHGDLSGSETYYIGANVKVSSDAVVARGAVLVAAPNGQLIVESGVCIGAGAIIQAYGGTLILAAGANVGQGVLLLGAGTIGAQACIGAESTLIDPKVEANQVVPSRSLCGDTSRSLNPAQPPADEASSQNGKAPAIKETAAVGSTEPSAADNNGASLVPNTAVYGREQVMQLVYTLFPHRNANLSDSEES